MRDSDEESYRGFVAARWSALARVAFLLVGDRGHAEDLVQTVFAKMWFAWPRIRDTSPDAYARRALTNTAISWSRRRWHGERPTATLPERPVPHDPALDVIERMALATALSRLPPRQRAAVVLRFAEDMSETEVSRVLGCSIGNVKSLTSRGLARLRAAGIAVDVHEGELTSEVRT